MHPVCHHFLSRAQRALPCTPFVTIFAQGPEVPSHAPRSSPFLLKGRRALPCTLFVTIFAQGPKGPPMHPVRQHFCSRAEGPSARARRKRAYLLVYQNCVTLSQRATGVISESACENHSGRTSANNVSRCIFWIL